MRNSLSGVMKISISLTFAVMIAVNLLANLLPINGSTTGQISNSYPNLFTPAPVTFAVWGLIYILLAAHVLYQLGFIAGGRGTISEAADERLALLFSLSSAANAAWIFAWHYRIVFLSMLIMIGLLLCLIGINILLRRENLTTQEKIFLRLPFSIYFGWTTVATIANFAALLVSLGWKGGGLSEVSWTVIMIAAGTLIGGWTTIRLQDISYGFTLVWAYIGILVKNESESGLTEPYPQITMTVMVCLILILAAIFYVFRIKEQQGHFKRRAR